MSNSAALQIAGTTDWKRCARFATTIWPPIAQVVAAVQAMEAILAMPPTGHRMASCGLRLTGG